MKRTTLILTLVVVVIATLACDVAQAQRPTLSGRFSKDSIEVGDLVEYSIDIEKDRVVEIGIPDFDGELTPEQRANTARAKRSMSTYEEYDEDIFELIEDYPIDTISVDGRQLHIRKRYLLAVMETGDIPMIPTILYFEKNRELPDTLYAADTLRLHVARYAELDTMLFFKADPTSQQGIAVDSAKAMSNLGDEGINSLKNLPFIFDEIRDYLLYSATGAIIIGLLLWLVIWYVGRRMRNREHVVKPKPVIPPHIVANKALEELGHRKLWQNGKFKLYYSSLTEILKVYIVGRWGISALEMTTDEIIVALQAIEMPNNSRTDLITILRTADMVKFAKAQPEAEENEANFTRAFYFVENTKAVDVEHNEAKRDITIETNIEE